MALVPTNYTNYPFQPGVSQDAFIPDQLIGGDMKIVTKTVTITGGAYFRRGTVLGQIAVGAVGPAVATGGNTGNGVITGPGAGPRAKVGNYLVRMSGPTTFTVLDPHGLALANGNVLGAYADAEIGFTIAAGGTAFVAGDSFTIPFAADTNRYTIATAAAVNGSQTPVAILVDDVDTTSADALGSIYQMGEFNVNAVTLGTGITAAAATTALEAQNIYLKTPISAADPP